LFDDAERTEFTDSAQIAQSVVGNVITYTLTFKNFVPNESVEKLWHVPAGKPVRRVITAITDLPCAVFIQNQFFELVNGGKVISERCTSIGLVPADLGHGYHFTAVSSSFGQTEEDKQAQAHVLSQDVFAIEQIQKYFEEHPDTAVETTVPTDKLGILSRRLMDELVRKEEGATVGS
jgi:hypothetical protein